MEKNSESLNFDYYRSNININRAKAVYDSLAAHRENAYLEINNLRSTYKEEMIVIMWANVIGESVYKALVEAFKRPDGSVAHDRLIFFASGLAGYACHAGVRAIEEKHYTDNVTKCVFSIAPKSYRTLTKNAKFWDRLMLTRYRKYYSLFEHSITNLVDREMFNDTPGTVSTMVSEKCRQLYPTNAVMMNIPEVKKRVAKGAKTVSAESMIADYNNFWEIIEADVQRCFISYTDWRLGLNMALQKVMEFSKNAMTPYNCLSKSMEGAVYIYSLNLSPIAMPAIRWNVILLYISTFLIAGFGGIFGGEAQTFFLVLAMIVGVVSVALAWNDNRYKKKFKKSPTEAQFATNDNYNQTYPSAPYLQNNTQPVPPTPTPMPQSADPASASTPVGDQQMQTEKQPASGNNTEKDEQKVKEAEQKRIDDIFFAQLDKQRENDPLVGAKLGAKEIYQNLIPMLMDPDESNGRRLNVNKMLLFAGGLAGMACQMAVWQKYVYERKEPIGSAFVVTTTKGGKNYFFGDKLNSYLLEAQYIETDRLDPQYSVLSLALGTFRQICPDAELPEIKGIVRKVAGSIGNDEYKIHGFVSPDMLMPNIKKLWNMFLPRVSRFCKTSDEWHILYGMVLQMAMEAAAKFISPSECFDIGMESAVSISKMEIFKVHFEKPAE